MNRKEKSREMSSVRGGRQQMFGEGQKEELGRGGQKEERGNNADQLDDGGVYPNVDEVMDEQFRDRDDVDVSCTAMIAASDKRG